MFQIFRRIKFVAPIIVASLTIAATHVQAQENRTVEGGRTTVYLSAGFVSALGSLGVTPGTVSPTKLRDGKVDFPITGGAIDLHSAFGQIVHSGGLTLTDGKTEVALQSFIIDTTGTSPVITGLVAVDGKQLGRLTLFDLILPEGFATPLKAEFGFLALKDIGVTLDKTAAGALNSVFKVSAFTKGFGIGTAEVVTLLQCE